MFYILFFTSVLTSWAGEGLFKPDLNHMSPTLMRALRSTAAVGFASGVVVEDGKILTAYHVVDDCGCPSPGTPLSCIREIHVPKTVSDDGDVVAWLDGRSDFIIACGVNAVAGKTELIEQTLKTLGTDAIYDIGLGPYWPKQDIAVLHVNWQTEVPPSIEIRSEGLKPYTTILASGFPGRTLRSFEFKDLRISTMQRALEQMGHLKVVFALAGNIGEGLTSLRTEYDSTLESWRDMLGRYDDSSMEKRAIEDGAMNSLSQIGIFLTAAEEGAVERACNYRNDNSEGCQSSVIQRLMDLQINRTQSIVNSIRLQSQGASYPDADGSLRVGIGQFRYYQNNPVPGIQGGIATDVDGAGGDSGGPIFDTDGKLVGITVFGPAGSSLGYSPGNGINGVSHWGILNLLKK
jgi:hypothetical protein